MSLIRNVMLGLVVSGIVNTMAWTQDSSSDRSNLPSAPVASDDTAGESTSVTSQSIQKSSTANVDMDGKYEVIPGVDPDNHLFLPFAKHLADDQYSFWTAPAHFKGTDLEWGVPFAGVTAGFIASDSWLSKQIPLGEISRSKTISDYGAYSFIGAGAGAFVFGHLTGNDRMSEAGFLSGEAAINSTAVAYLFKSITQRPRPYQANGSGKFFQGGSSFPSEHSAIAWSVASVMAHEYPGTLTQILAYGLATTVTATRVTGQQHFASDVIIGSALGWYFGRQVYRSHHDTTLGGEAWGDALPEKSGEKTRNPENMGSPYVPLDSWVYLALERLVALGYIKTAYLGIRPWTRLECARMLDEAQQNIADEDDPSGQAPRIYGELAKEFSSETGRLNGATNMGASLDSVYARVTNISGPPLRDGYHFGQTITNDFGRPIGEGLTLVTGVGTSAVVGPLAISIRGEYQRAGSVLPLTPLALQDIARTDIRQNFVPLGFSVNTGSISRFRLLDASVSLTFHNLQFSFGKQSNWLGPGDFGPLLMSDNAEPATMLKIDNTAPLLLGPLSHLLGPARAEFFIGRLSGSQWIFQPPTLYGPHITDQPFIHGTKVSFHPTHNLEFGFGLTALFGGPGLPVTWHNFLRTFYSHKSNLADNPGKRFSSFDFNYRVPGLRDWLSVYVDSLVVDEYSPIGSTRPSVNPGLYLSRFPRLPKLDLRVEGFKTNHPMGTCCFPGSVYWDLRYNSGYTNDGNLMGTWIGRAGYGGQAWMTYSLRQRTKFQLGYRHQEVDRAFIGGGRLIDYSANADVELTRDVSLSGLVQQEQWRFPVLSSVARFNTTAQFEVQFHPHWQIQK